MIPFLKARVRGFFWRPFNPMVRVGWYFATGGGTGSTLARRAGLGMIFAGLALGRRKKVLLYATTVPDDHSVRVRVVQDGRTIAAG